MTIITVQTLHKSKRQLRKAEWESAFRWLQNGDGEQWV